MRLVPKKDAYFQTIIDELMSVLKNIYIYLKEKKQIIDKLKLAQQYNNGIPKNRKFVKDKIESTI